MTRVRAPFATRRCANRHRPRVRGARSGRRIAAMLGYRSASMRMSRLFLRTLRDDPADAEIASHRLLLRAGCVRRVASGIYAWLPLGQRVLAKVAQIVRE